MQSRMSRLIRKPVSWVGLAVWGVVSAVLLTCVNGCGRHAAANGDGNPTEEALAVTAVSPKVETIQRSVVQPGFIASYEETPIYTKIAGFIEKVPVDIGDRFKKGDLLGELWVPEVEEDVRVKKHKIDQGEANVELADRAVKVASADIDTWTAQIVESMRAVERADANVSRWKHEYEVDLGLVDKGVLDRQTVDEAFNKWRASQATLGEAKAKLEADKASKTESDAKYQKAQADYKVAKELLSVWEREHKVQQDWFDYAKITAPFAGVVTRRFVHSGHFVQPANSGTTSRQAEPLFMVMRTDIVRVIVQVPESSAPLIKDHALAVIRIPSLRNREIPAEVKRSSWMLDTASRTLRTEIHVQNPLQNPNEELQSGMYVEVSIKADVPNALVLPVEAVIVENDKTYCYMVEDGKAKRVNVKPGKYNNQWIEMLAKQVPATTPSAAPEGTGSQWVSFTGKEKVIVTQLNSIHDGQAVTIK
jgi:HlyD family secretion protein